MKNDTKSEQALLLCALLSVALAGVGGASPLLAKKAAPHARKADLKPNVGPKAKAPGGSASRTGDYIITFPDAPPMPVSPVDAAEAAQSDALCKSGAALAAKSDWAGAAGDYQQAVALDPGSQEALYGAARSAVGVGDVASALDYYRTAIYTSAPFPYARKLREPYSFRSMPFVLLLNESGRAEEAVSVYNDVVGLLNHEDGREHAEEVELPEFGNGPGQAPYSPQDLEAMAYLVIGSQTPGFDVADLRRAVALAPDSAAANFYMGKYLYGRNDAQAKAFLEKAVQLGDDHTAAAAKGFLQFIR